MATECAPLTGDGSLSCPAGCPPWRTVGLPGEPGCSGAPRGELRGVLGLAEADRAPEGGGVFLGESKLSGGGTSAGFAYLLLSDQENCDGESCGRFIAESSLRMELSSLQSSLPSPMSKGGDAAASSSG